MWALLSLNSSVVALISAIERKISTKSNDLCESTFLFQRLAITLQRFDSVLLRDSFVYNLEKWPFQQFLESAFNGTEGIKNNYNNDSFRFNCMQRVEEVEDCSRWNPSRELPSYFK